MVAWIVYTCNLRPSYSTLIVNFNLQHAEALAQLREKKEEVSRLSFFGESDKKKSADFVEALQVGFCLVILCSTSQMKLSPNDDKSSHRRESEW